MKKQGRLHNQANQRSVYQSSNIPIEPFFLIVLLSGGRSSWRFWTAVLWGNSICTTVRAACRRKTTDLAFPRKYKMQSTTKRFSSGSPTPIFPKSSEPWKQKKHNPSSPALFCKVLLSPHPALLGTVSQLLQILLWMRQGDQLINQPNRWVCEIAQQVKQMATFRLFHARQRIGLQKVPLMIKQ